MSHAFQAHTEILPEAQRRLWPELRSTSCSKFIICFLFVIGRLRELGFPLCQDRCRLLFEESCTVAEVPICLR